MPPEENKNINTNETNTYKVGLNPVFKNNFVPQTNIPKSNINTGISAIINNQKYTPNVSIPLTPRTTTNNLTNRHSIIRTYKGDLESAIQSDHISSINIAMAEDEKMRNQIMISNSVGASTTSDYSKNKIIIFISTLLIITGVIGVSVVYYFSAPSPSPVVKVQELPALITTEYKDELNIDLIKQGNFILALSSKINDINITVNNLYNTYITLGTGSTRRLVSANEFVTLANFKIPDIIKRTLLPDYMVGMFSYSGQNLPFIIIKTSYFENAYAGMLEWEKNMEDDMRILFRLEGYNNGGGILAELTPSSFRKFEDDVINNKDVRLLRADNGKVILLYGIIDKETIVITVSDPAFKEIITRLNQEKSLKR